MTEKKVRRERMGHIKLVVPVVHIWFFKSLPNKIGYLLGLSSKKLETIIYYERYVVIQAGVKEEEIEHKALLTEEEYFEVLDSCLLYTSPSPRDRTRSRMPSSA